MTSLRTCLSPYLKLLTKSPVALKRSFDHDSHVGDFFLSSLLVWGSRASVQRWDSCQRALKVSSIAGYPGSFLFFFRFCFFSYSSCCYSHSHYYSHSDFDYESYCCFCSHSLSCLILILTRIIVLILILILILTFLATESSREVGSPRSSVPFSPPLRNWPP